MSPIVHAEMSWLLGHWLKDRRDRLLIVAAGVVLDVDGLTILAGEDWYGRLHHKITHGVLAAIVIVAVTTLFARARWRVALTAGLVFHLHVLSDLVGSGPGWPLYYWIPFSQTEWFWDGQWDLASWQNALIGLGVTIACLLSALWAKRTFVEVFSKTWDQRVVFTIRQRFQKPDSRIHETRSE